jgi:glucose-6-phosphate 1-dehydrogenase
MWPDERIEMLAWAKEPDVNFSAQPIVLATPYKHTTESDATAYEQLLLDVLDANHGYFLRFDEVEEAWRIVQPVLDAWAHGKPEVYVAGSQGPAAQDRLMAPNHTWRPINLA